MLARAAPCVLALATALSSAACSLHSSLPLIAASAAASPPPPPDQQMQRILYVANRWGNSIFTYDPGNGRQERTISDGIDGPFALAEDGSGNLFVANSGPGSSAGSISVYAPGSPTPARVITAHIYQLGSIAVDAAGDVFAGNRWANHVYVYASGETRATRTITHGVVAVNALAVDATGYLYVSNCQSCLYPTSRGTVTIYRPKSDAPFLTIHTGHGGAGMVAFDSDGKAYVDVGDDVNVYDRHSARLVRKIAGAAGLLYVDDFDNLYSGQRGFINSGGRVLVYAPGATVPSYAITSGIYDPAALSADTSGRLFVANSTHNEISVYPKGSATPSRKIVVATGLDDPESIAFDAANDLFVANGYESTVTVYPPGSSKVLRTITSGIVSPSVLTFDPAGNLYVGNLYGDAGGSIRSAFITVYAPGKSEPMLKIKQDLHGPTYVMLFDRDSNLYVASGCPWFSEAISVYAAGTKSLLRTIGRPGITPCAMKFDSSGNLYVASVGLPGAVSVFTPGSQDPSRMITDGVDYPDGLAFDSSGNLYVTNAYGGNSKSWGSISIYRPGARKPFRRVLRQIGNAPGDPVVAPSGELYVGYGHKIVVYDPGGAKLRTITQGLDAPTSMAFDAHGSLYVANTGNNTITVYKPESGELSRVIRGAKAYPDALVLGPGAKP
jgi:sugar lactone lactonase YvrE